MSMMTTKLADIEAKADDSGELLLHRQWKINFERVASESGKGLMK